MTCKIRRRHGLWWAAAAIVLWVLLHFLYSAVPRSHYIMPNRPRHHFAQRCHFVALYRFKPQSLRRFFMDPITHVVYIGWTEVCR